jgi:hypothetical protein
VGSGISGKTLGEFLSANSLPVQKILVIPIVYWHRKVFKSFTKGARNTNSKECGDGLDVALRKFAGA